MAFGAGYRKEGAVNFADPRGAQAAFNTGNWGYFPPSHYYVYEGFGEISAPVLKNNIVESLDVTMAGRITDYSTSGMVETWKLGATSQINDDIKLRTTWSVDIRAPQLSDLFTPVVNSNNNFVDPKTGVTVSGFTAITGNPNLVPEVARTISGGMILTPHWIDGLQFSVDWYSINLSKAIAQIPTNLILSTCAININDPLCSRITFAGPGGAFSSIKQFNVNIATINTGGMDLSADYKFEFWEGDLDVHSVATYMDHITVSQPGNVNNDYAGVISSVYQTPSSTSTPKWKGIMSAAYSADPWEVTLQARWYGSGIVTNLWNTGNLATAATAHMVDQSDFQIDPTAYLDLRLSYTWNDNLTFYGAVDNIQNIPPQLTPGWYGDLIHYYQSSQTTYDLFGRQFRIGIRFSY